jgi:hypothetical protein
VHAEINAAKAGAGDHQQRQQPGGQPQRRDAPDGRQQHAIGDHRCAGVPTWKGKALKIGLQLGQLMRNVFEIGPHAAKRDARDDVAAQMAEVGQQRPEHADFPRASEPDQCAQRADRQRRQRGCRKGDDLDRLREPRCAQPGPRARQRKLAGQTGFACQQHGHAERNEGARTGDCGACGAAAGMGVCWRE